MQGGVAAQIFLIKGQGRGGRPERKVGKRKREGIARARREKGMEPMAMIFIRHGQQGTLQKRRKEESGVLLLLKESGSKGAGKKGAKKRVSVPLKKEEGKIRCLRSA